MTRPLAEGLATQFTVFNYDRRGRGDSGDTAAGGFPGAPPEAAGRDLTFTGTDILRIADGKLAEYWANADSLLFFQQLGVPRYPPPGDYPPGRPAVLPALPPPAPTLAASSSSAGR
jgi:hypothetical protein